MPPQPEPEPEAIHEAGGPSHQPDIIVPRHVASSPRVTYQKGHRTLFAAARRVLSRWKGSCHLLQISECYLHTRWKGPHILHQQRQYREGKQPMIEDERSGDAHHDFIDLDVLSPSSDFYELIR